MKKLLLLLSILCVSAALSAAPAKAKKTVKKAPAKKAAVSAAPVFSLPQVRSGTQWTTLDYTGTPLLIAVVSSGCTYCQKTLVQLEEARKALRDVQFVAVFTDEVPLKPLELLRQHNIRTDAVYGGGSLADKLNVNGVPMLFLYDAKHQLLKTFNGYADSRVKELKNAAGDLEKEVNVISVEGNSL